MIPEGMKANFETLKAAILNGDAALMEVKDSDTGRIEYAVCGVTIQDGEAVFCPIAILTAAHDNPYERYQPPNPDGGFHEPLAKTV